MVKVCSIKGCGKTALAQSFCPAHYQRWRKTGDPLGSQPRPSGPKEALRCAHCGDEFLRAAKEIKRQKAKKGDDINFFCSLSCACVWRMASRSNEQRERDISILVDRNKARRGTRYVRPDNEFWYYLRQANTRDAEKSLGMDLDQTYLRGIWRHQDGRCALSGIYIHLKTWDKKTRLDTASLDRIDSCKGYVRGNVQFVALGVNLAKNVYSDSEVRDFIALIRGQTNFASDANDGAETLRTKSSDTGAVPVISTTCGDEIGSTGIGSSELYSA